MNSLEHENAYLRHQLQELKSVAEANHAVLRGARAREHRLLSAQTLPELFDTLVNYLRRSFALAEVSVVLEDPWHQLRHLAAAGQSGRTALPAGLRFCQALEQALPGYPVPHRPQLGPFREAEHGALFTKKRPLGSVAVMGLRRERSALGVLALGAEEPHRFHSGLATDCLHNLAVVAAISLDNATNRATLLNGALTDPLTGLRNRRYLETRLSEELARARRERRPLSCLLLDVDYFKRVNDTYGHLAGDDVLRELAQRVLTEVRASDVCARYGGEELAILLPATRRNDALALAERVRRVVCEAPIIVGEDRAVTVTASIGVATVMPTNADNADGCRRQLLGGADAALYRAKAGGRDRVCNAA
jgi:two-component system cell cycle response regulator